MPPRALGTGELPLAWKHQSRKKYEMGLRKLDSESESAGGGGLSVLTLNIGKRCL